MCQSWRLLIPLYALYALFYSHTRLTHAFITITAIHLGAETNINLFRWGWGNGYICYYTAGDDGWQHLLKCVCNEIYLFLKMPALLSRSLQTTKFDLCVHRLTALTVRMSCAFRVPTTNQGKHPAKMACGDGNDDARATNNYWQIVTKPIDGRWAVH